MRNNKHKDSSTPSYMITKSKRYWAGSKRNKRYFGAKKNFDLIPPWERRCTEQRPRWDIELLKDDEILSHEVLCRYAKVLGHKDLCGYALDDDVRITSLLQIAAYKYR